MMQKKALRPMILYAAFSLLTLVFGIVYTHFGHGVTSPYMTYAFVPTIVAALFYLIFAIIPKIPRPKTFSALFLAFSVTSFTLNSITKGILQIAGAYSDYDVILYDAAIVCLILACAAYVTELAIENRH